MECLILVAEKNGPTMFARIGVMRALNPPRRVVGCKRTVVSRRHGPREGPYRTTTAIRPCNLWSPALQWCGGLPQISTFLAEKGGRGCSWRDVLDLQAVGEFDKAHFQVLGFRDAMGGFHHAFQPLSIGGDQRHVFTGH